MKNNKRPSVLSGVTLKLLHDGLMKRETHPDIAVLYNVKGASKVLRWKNALLCKAVETVLEKEDILVINMDEPYQITTGEESALCEIRIFVPLLLPIMPEGNCWIDCCSVKDTKHSFRKLKNVCRKIVLDYFTRAHRTRAALYSLVYQILDILTENFQMAGQDILPQNRASDEQVRNVMGYVNLHYGDPIRLKDLADRQYTSAATLSRMFRKETGIYFEDYVRNIRLTNAAVLLEETQDSITRIALDVGFSSPSSFHRAFLAQFGLSPSEYRKKSASLCAGKESGKGNERTLCAAIDESEFFITELNEMRQLLPRDESEAIGEEQILDFTVQAGQEEEWHHPWSRMINAGSIKDLLLSNTQYHVQYLYKNLHARYVHIWNLFSSTLMGPYIPGERQNYQSIDSALDFLVKERMVPFISLGVRPETNASGDNRTIYYENVTRHIPDKKAWFEQLYYFLTHVIRRYGSEETSRWIFDFDYNFSGHVYYYDGEEKNFLEIFREGFSQIKRQLPNAIVGGFGDFDLLLSAKLHEWIAFCKENNCIPDYLSSIYFPYSEEIKDGIGHVRRNGSPSDDMTRWKDMKVMLLNNGLQDMPLCVSEWNHVVSNRNYMNDSCSRAAWILEEAGTISPIPNLMAIWMGTDWSSFYYDIARPTFGGSGILTRDGIRKPAYYALTFLEKTGNVCLARNERFIVTRNREYTWTILLNNAKDFSTDYFLQKEETIKPENLNEFFKDLEPLTIRLDLYVQTGLSTGAFSKDASLNITSADGVNSSAGSSSDGASSAGSSSDGAFYSTLHSGDSLSREKTTNIDSAPSLLKSLDLKSKVSLPKRFRCQKMVLNEHSGSLISEWEKLQFIEDLDSSQMHYLRDHCNPQLLLEHIEALDGIIHIEEKLEANEIRMLQITVAEN